MLASSHTLASSHLGETYINLTPRFRNSYTNTSLPNPLPNLPTSPHLPITPNANDLSMPSVHVNHRIHQYTLIPRVLYLRRWGWKRWSLAFGRSGRVTVS
ncbi:hypothetical protein ACQY0O_000614 [Thecaphora frezii]